MTDEAMVEAVARAICKAEGVDPDAMCSIPGPSLTPVPVWTVARDEAIAAIRALAPLIIEQCAEVARHHADAHARSLGAYGAADVDSGRGRQEGHIDAGNAIAQGILALNHFGDADEMVRALIQKEASGA